MGDGSINADHEGAGLASALWSNRILVAGDGQYGGYQIGATTASEVVEQKIAVQAGQKVRVVVSWNSQVNGTSDSLLTDFDLQVVQPNGATSGSYSLDNNYEVVEFTAAGSGTATIRLPHNRFDTGSQRFGLAWTKWNLGTPSRVGGADRYEVAAGISARTFAPNVPAAFVATGRTFPDALTAGPVAGLAKAPILLTRPTDIPSATTHELARLKPQRIYVLGGTGSVPAAIADQLQAYTAAPVSRIGGVDRYEVAANLAERFFTPGTGTAFVATGRTFPDALSAGPAAAAVGAPILLVRDSIPDATRAALARLQPQQIYLLGGTGSVSASVASQLQAYSSQPIVRIGGADRYEVAAGIAHRFFAFGVSAAFVATGATFPDALAAVPAAAQVGGPLLLVRTTSIPAPIVGELRRLWPPQTVVLGGPASVAESVLSDIRSLLGNP
jgi:putative cell wall-binding protein